MATFDGYTVESTVLSAAECKAAAVAGRLREVFGVDDEGNFAPDIDLVRTWAVGEVNRQAGEARSRIGTNIPFQGDVYQLKGAEAAGFAVDTEPTAAKYPVLYAESAARGMTPAELAAEYAYNAVMWPQIIAAIEAVRMGAQTAIKAAADVDGVAAALAAVEWPV